MASVEKIPVTVVIAPRESFDGYWCVGRKFNTGKTDLEVTPDELAQIKSDEAKGLPIAVVEYSVAEAAARLADSAKRDAEAAKAAAAEAALAAKAKADAAAAAEEAAELAALAAAEKAEADEKASIGKKSKKAE